MKKLSFFFAGMLLFLFLQQTQAQFPFARHYWINLNSYNHTLYPTSDGGYILAAARQQLVANARNTIAVFKLDRFYQVQNSRIIGLSGSGIGGGFDVSVNFEVHDIIGKGYKEGDVGEDWNEEDGYYVICGSISHSGSTNMGMVTILNQALNVVDIREYSAAEVFYSVYADGNYFYVCGKTPSGDGIVLRDYLFSSTIPAAAHITNDPWTYHKIKPNNYGQDLVVSGTDGVEIGFTAFNIAGGNFTLIANASRKFTPQGQPNAKAIVANYQGNPQGLMIASSEGAKIFTYFFNNYNQATVSGFTIISPQGILLLEDMAVVNINNSQVKMAWVGNYIFLNQPNNPMAFYTSADVSFLSGSWSVSSPVYIDYPPISSEYFRLHKVHYNAGDFHCGGFYNHSNNNKTTFVVAPEQAVHKGCGTATTPMVAQNDNAATNRLVVSSVTVTSQSNKWHQVQYNFCITDCDDTPLNATANANCGN